MEMLAEVRAFAFDKTGTLTTGQAEVTGLVALEGTGDSVLALLAGIEAQSEHHIAGAVRRHAAERGVVPVAVGQVQAWPSEGISGVDATGPLWAGNARMVQRMAADGSLGAVRGGDQTVVYLGRGARMLGAVTVADAPRLSAAAGIAALRVGGIAEVVMMTGDRREVALRIGGALGFAASEVHAGLLPVDKVQLLDDLAAKGRGA